MNARRLVLTSSVLCLAFVGLVSACADDGSAGDDEVGSETAGESGTTTGDGDTGESGTTTTTGDGDTGTTTTGDGDTGTDTDTGTTGDGDGDIDPEAICDSPLSLYDTSSPTVVIGDGSPGSCTGAALKSAAEAGGTITFDCGPDPVTLSLDEGIVLPVDIDTIIDGEDRVTLDAQGMVRHFTFDHPDWMNNPTIFALQRIRLINGQAPAGEYFPQDPNNPECAYGYKEGSGGAVYVRNGVVHIIDADFENNQAALEGPDVGGGAIYVVGVPEIVITGSRFIDNRAANGGAVGMLFANPEIYNSHFEGNTAEGIGQNYVEPGCPNFNHDEQGGAGGNSGAVYFDGLNDVDDEGLIYRICGAVFRENKANELGGALFRTPNVAQRDMEIDRCLFDGNTARLGGVSFIKDNFVGVFATTFMNNRSGVNVAGEELGGPLGGLWINNGSVAVENSTFYNNQPSGLDVEGQGGLIVNATFVDSRPGGDGLEFDNSLFVDTNCNATFAGSNNLQWPEGGTDCAQGTSYADPELGPIGDNGGPTPTLLPAADGAVEGVGTSCPDVDQRGEPRDPQSCAAGSVEP